MEICYLNYEIIQEEFKENSQDIILETSKTRLNGKSIYNPSHNSIEFYDMEDNLILSKKLKTITQLYSFIKDNKIAFRENDDLITINYDRKDIFESKSFSFLQSKILSEINRKQKEEHIESKRILSNPKEYQLEILELAKQRNTIVFLETGLGKTYISILLIKHLFGEPLEANCRLRLSYPKKTQKKVIFLFKTISLLLQQTKVLKHNLNLKIIKLYGGQDSQNTTAYYKFRKIIERTDIICGTPETIYRYFTFGYLTQSDVCLIVLDECHHAKDKDYYNLIMKHFVLDTRDKELSDINQMHEVKVLGLTASPSFDSEKSEEKITENIQKLCDNLNSYLACPTNIFKELEGNGTTDGVKCLDKELKFILLSKFKSEVKEIDIKSYIFNEIVSSLLLAYMQVKKFFHSELLECVYLTSLITALVAEEEKITEKHNGIFDKYDYQYMMGCDWILKLPMFKNFLDRFKLELDKGEEKVNFNRELRDATKIVKEDFFLKEMKKFTKNINLIIKYTDMDSIYSYTLLTFDSIKIKIFEIFQKNGYTDIINKCYNHIKQLSKSFLYTSPYISAIQSFFDEIMDRMINEKIPSSKSIIFTNHRLITKLLNDKVNKHLLLKGFSSRFVVGCQSQATITFSEEELKSNIDFFSTEEKCLVLFATDVVEEGIDIPQCNNVINLAEIKSIKEFIQKSGRARQADSSIYLLCNDENDAKISRNNIEQIKLATKAMKKIVTDNKMKPKISKDKLIANLNYYQTKANARVYLSYAKKLVEEFLGKLFFDGYSFLKATFKVEEKSIVAENVQKTVFLPFLSLPSVLESNFTRIFDNDDVYFNTKEEARKYFDKFEDYFYLKAVKLLHLNNYLDDHFIFTKHYDELIHLENNCSKFQSEPKLILKSCTADNKSVLDDFVELKAHIIELSPNYIDISFNKDGDASGDLQKLAIISDNPIILTNFDIYIHSVLLLKLYYFNNFVQSEDSQKQFLQKPKIPYNVFTKINLSITNCITVRIRREQIDLINFFYSYILFFSTDSELLFYYSIYCEKFDFSNKLFLNDPKIKNYLKFIFEKYSLTDLKQTEKKHLMSFANMNPDYSNHMIKFSIMKYDEKEEKFEIDFEYITNILTSVKANIQSYFLFLKNCVNSEEEIQKMSSNSEYLDEKEDQLRTIREESEFEEPVFGSLCRNMLNYSKYFLLNYGLTDLRGSTQYKNQEFNYQTYFLQKYSVLTDRFRDYKKHLPLDYNEKVLKYKININQLGKVAKHFGKSHYLKKFQFLPNELIQSIDVITPDQMHLFTLFPLILHKVQHSLIYYYQAFCLRKRFDSFRSLNLFNLRLLMQSLNAKSTLECENYERLEFLGDSVLKFLSSFEVIKLYPDANRDLLYSKRRQIENNKSLYAHAIGDKNKLYEFLFTTPISMKKVMIPGFGQDDSMIFNIGYNRSFAKSCFNSHKGEVKSTEVTQVDRDKASVYYKENIIQENNIESEELLLDKKPNEDKDFDLGDEEKTERTAIKILYEENPDPVYLDQELYIDDAIINTVVNDRIEIIHSKSFRILNNKVFADLIESLVGFFLHYSYTEGKLSDLFKRSSGFLQELGVLEHTVNDCIDEEFWLKNLKNPKCKFNDNDKYIRVKPIAENKRYTFKNLDLLYQACTHPSYLTEESMKENFPYVNKSYQRLAFLGESFLSFYVSLWVYLRNPDANECLLHKLKICGINHHIISLIAIDMKLDDCLLKKDRDIDCDIKIYKDKFLEMRQKTDNKYRLKHDSILDDNFIIILCEMLHAYIGAVLLDSQDVEKTFFVVKSIMDDYLLNNATVDTYSEHPKVIILDEFFKRAHYLKKLRENGSNRVSFKNEKGEKFRRLKMYKYQLIIDDLIIYEEYIYYNRSTIKIAQEKAKDIFLKICNEIDRREKMGLSLKYFELKSIVDYLEIPYEKYKMK